MCGRFTLTHPNDALARLFDAAPANDLPQPPRYNICPTQAVAVVACAEAGGGRQLRAMRWGFLPHWYRHAGDGPLLINARAEGIADRPAFRAAVRSRRCLIPATGFYEWTKDADGRRLPWYLRPAAGDEPLALAGVWQDWQAPGSDEAPQPCCAVVTCDASRDIAAIHHRMPLILPAGDWALWLGEAGHGAARLLATPPEGLLAFHRVAPAVNSNRASGANLIERLDGQSRPPDRSEDAR